MIIKNIPILQTGISPETNHYWDIGRIYDIAEKIYNDNPRVMQITPSYQEKSELILEKPQEFSRFDIGKVSRISIQNDILLVDIKLHNDSHFMAEKVLQQEYFVHLMVKASIHEREGIKYISHLNKTFVYADEKPSQFQNILDQYLEFDDESIHNVSVQYHGE